MRTTQNEINDILWRACDTFRGVIDSSDYKNSILVMLFLKYLSDVGKERRAALEERYFGNPEMIERQLARERFILPEKQSFDYLFRRRDADNIGELIDQALEEIEDANRAKLEGVFRNISFNSDVLGQTRDRNRRLKNLLEDFAVPQLDLRPSRVSQDVIGNAYMYLLERFASGAGKKGGEYYTPHGVSVLLAQLLRAQPGDRICDPACGSGSLLLEVAKAVRDLDDSWLFGTPQTAKARPIEDYSLYGQEANGGTWALCSMNMFLHAQDSALIKWGDTLNNPLLVESDRLMKFDIVVANPPFSLDKWGAEHAARDEHNRFWRGVPPKSKGDYAFITHMVETALPRQGRVGVIVPHGVLFRGGAEGKIRRALIEENLLDAVIGLPANLFYGTGIPAAVLLFDRSREPGGANEARRDILFVDASRGVQPGQNQNALGDSDIERIAETHRERRDEPRYSRVVPPHEIQENDFNLNISRYVETFEAEEEIDLGALQAEIEGLESQLQEVRARLKEHLRELELIER